MKHLSNIVVGTDFSDIALHALDEAIDLAKLLGATITLVHAYEIPVYGFPDGILVASSNFASQLQSAGQRQLDEAVAARSDRGVTIRSVLRMGAPWEEINKVAEETGAGLIVAATHGRRGLTRALLGSVAERLMRTATLPVLIIHGAK